MTSLADAIEVAIERTIPAPPAEVFDGWLDPRIPGALWHGHEKLIFSPEIDGLWYLLTPNDPKGTPHYGRFIEIDRPSRLQHSWMSRNTLGEETIVTVTFQEAGEDTLLILRHSGLPNSEMAMAHEKGWNAILDKFTDIFIR